MAGKKRVLTQSEDEFVRKLLQGVPTSEARKGRMLKRTAAFKHYNADGFSHTSMSAAFRRYGKRN